MKQYQSNKIVHAKPMTSSEWKEHRVNLTNYSNASLVDDLEGYMVVYNYGKPNEYWSWSPKGEFDNGHIETGKGGKAFIGGMYIEVSRGELYVDGQMICENQIQQAKFTKVSNMLFLVVGFVIGVFGTSVILPSLLG